MTLPPYNSIQYYQEMFGDVICCIGDEDCKVENVVTGFLSALDEQEAYHSQAIDRIRTFRTILSTQL